MDMSGASPLRILSREAARPEWVREHRLAPWGAVLAVCIGAFMGQLDASIVTLAFPRLRSDFGASLAAVQWVSLAYLAALAVLLIPVGRWSDAHGRKLLYINGFVLFTLASAACGFAPSLGWLVTGRAVQALGAALLQANSVALVVRSLPRAKVRAALGVQAAAQALGLAVGPMLGGVLMDAFGWRAVFLVNVPVGVVAVVAGVLLLPRSRSLSGGAGEDPAGNVLLAVTVLAVLGSLSLVAGGGHGGLASAAAATAVLGGLAFWGVERRVASPLVPPARLRRSGVGIGLVGALLGYLVLFAPLVLYPLLFDAWGMTSSRGGLVLTCLPAGFAAAALLGGRVGRSIGNAARVQGGAAVATACALGQAALWDSPAAVAVLLFLTGAALGVVLPANNAMVMTAVPAEASAVTGGMINVARAGGTSLGVALTSVGVQVAALAGRASAPVVLVGLAVAGAALAATGRTARSRARRGTVSA